MGTETRAPHRVAIVGAGSIGRRHAALLAASPRTMVAAVVDPDPRAEAVADANGAPWLADLDRLLDRDRPDAAIIATPNALHREQAERCIARGIPVLVEKPIATSVEDGERIADAAERRGVPVLVGHHRRHSSFLAAAQGLVGDGALGQVVAVSATTIFAKPSEYFAAAPWRREPGGGPVLINLIHDVDALRALAGEVAEVHAIASGVVRGLVVEDSAAVILRFVGGAIGTMLLSDVAASPLSWESTSGEDPIYPRYTDRDCYVVAGTHGTLGVPTMRLTTSDGDPSWHRTMVSTTIRVEPADPLQRQLDHFCDVIDGAATPASSARDAVESLRVTLAIAEAASTGRAVACAPSGAMAKPSS
ncbi:MAG TPA: Gfo/Idh/MocA family oxidoreductase [Candidatus Angelobacter sp.]|nr:Gfo/Idh/MocA family oxidoreductase [Candidatus Angelobacter sp.]